jgi:hypothetical protein
VEGSGHFRLYTSIRTGGECITRNFAYRSSDHNEKNETGRTCGTQSREERCIQEFGE